MKSLELLIPPPVVAAVVAVAMWGVSLVAPRLHMPAPVRLIACDAFVCLGLVFSVAGVVSFRRARTTINPTKPEAASSLVTSGIYRVTRNPMYVGLSFVLTAWAVFLSSAWALLGPLLFVRYIGRFQIAPEERILSKLFGSEYTAYQERVRRWL
jgi:protein-S-isoprenylcysteine O-methyltransferase Ste14